MAQWLFKHRDNFTFTFRCQLDVTGSGYGPVAGSCGHGHESLVSIQCVEFLD
jgi:hypothetical protein